MYQAFYGLREMPFSITPDPKFLFLSRKHQEALDHLKFGIEEKKGFIVLTGEVGCGKTTLCRRLLDELDEAGHFDTALIVNPRLSESQLLRAILNELGEPTRERRRNQLMERLQEVLFERLQDGREIVLLIDEAQNMEFPALEQLRLVSNMETDKQKLIQTILVGQPELKEILNQERLRQFKQRVLVHYDLDRLGSEEVQHYIVHRLNQAGACGRVCFSWWAVRLIHRFTQGTPRLINAVCDKALLAAYVRESGHVGWRDVRRAIREIRKLG
jgi:general secretion pathway protein A